MLETLNYDSFEFVVTIVSSWILRHAEVDNVRAIRCYEVGSKL